MRTRRWQREWLTALLDRHRDVQAGAWSRRKFLGGAAAAALTSVPGFGHSTDYPAQPPDFDSIHDVLTIRFGSGTWVIDPRRFGPDARARCQPRREELLVRLDRAAFPGTTLSADFTARLWNPGNGWRIDFRWQAKRSRTDLAGHEFPLLVDWMAGIAEFEFDHSDGFEAGASSVEVLEQSSASMRWTCALDPQVDGKLSIVLPIGEVACEELCLEARYVPALERANTDLVSQTGSFAKERLKLTTTTTDQSIWWKPTTFVVHLDCFSRHHRRHGSVVLSGGGLLQVNGPGTMAASSALELSSFLVVDLGFPPGRDLMGAFTLCRRPFLFETDAATLLLKGQADLTEEFSFRRGHQSDWSIKALLTRTYVPVRGVSHASLDLPDVEIDLVLGSGGRASSASAEALSKASSAKTPKPVEQEQDVATDMPIRLRGRTVGATTSAGAALRLGRRVQFELPLDAATLSLKRSIDLFDLKFEFRRYNLVVEGGKSFLSHRQTFGARSEVEPNPPLLIAVFPPQHLMEEVFKPPSKPGESKTEIRAINELIAPEDLARTLVSAPTRIAFQSSERTGHSSAPFELTVESITEWSELSLAVHKRALPRVSTLDQQLSAMGLTRQTSRADAHKTVLTELICPPSLEVTTLEPVTGIVISPDASARFDVPKRMPPSRECAPVWRARLRMSDGGAARVIHARGASMKFLSTGCEKEPSLSRFVSPLTTRDCAELVILMSGFAIPFMRRLHTATDDAGEMRFFDDPKGMIVRPESPPAFLSAATFPYKVSTGNNQSVTVNVAQEGLLVPRPFDEFDLVLTAFRSVLRAKWNGEPPGPLPNDPFFAKALNLEGYLHRAAYGRDALVQVAYKGFLFPLGHRATLLKVSERQFLGARGNADEVDPTAYLVQRLFIVCRRPKKDFPALGQPFQGREFPAARVEMLTTVTPDLYDVESGPPEQSINLKVASQRAPRSDGCGGDTASVAGRVFWPRTKPGEKDPSGQSDAYGNEVLFEYRFEDSDAPVRSPLVFVDNTAVHHAPTMEALIEYYATLRYDSMAGGTEAASSSAAAATTSWERAQRRLRVATHGGVTRRYAPATKAGQTSFDTAAWILGASGGIGATGTATASFAMDALMEGADQPPFYPRVERAFVKMQSLDRLLGRPQGLLEVGYSERYVRNGLDATANPSEIYLDVLRPAIDLDLTGQGDVAGGVAKPNARLAAISRVSGFVGGRPRADQTAGIVLRPRGAVPAGVPASSLTYDTTAAQAGRFDPVEFLGGAMSDAVLLGIIPLKDVVRSVAMAFAPQLEEIEEFGGRAIAEALKLACERIARGIDKAVDTGNAAMRQALAFPGVPPMADPLGQFYPALASRLRETRGLCRDVVQLRPDILSDRAGELAGRLVMSGRELVPALEAVAADPMPEGLKQVLRTLESLRDGLKDLGSVEGVKKFVIQDLAGPVRLALRGALEDFVGAPKEFTVFDTLFGIDCASGPTGAVCAEQRLRVVEEVLHHPEDAGRRLQHTLLHEVFSGPLISAWTPVSAFEARAGQVLIWSGQTLRESILQWLAQGDALIAALGPVLRTADEVLTQLDAAIRTFKASDLAQAGSVEVAARLLATRLSDEHLRKAIDGLKGALKADVDALREQIGQLSGAIAALTDVIIDPVKPQAAKDLAEADRALQIAAKTALERRKARLDELNGDKKWVIAEASAIRAMAETELRRQLLAWESQLRSSAEEALEQLAARLFACVGGAFHVGGQMLELVRIGEASRRISQWCAAGGVASKVLQAAVDIVLRPAPDLLKHLRDRRDASLDWRVPTTLPAQERMALDATLSTLRRTLAGAVSSVETLQLVLGRCKNNLADPCGNLQTATQDLTNALAARLRALEALRDLGLAQLTLAIDAVRVGAPMDWRLGAASAITAFQVNGCVAISELLKQVAATITFETTAFANQIRTPIADIDQILRPDLAEKNRPLRAMADRLQAGMATASGLVTQLGTEIGAACTDEEKVLRQLRKRYEDAFVAVVAHLRENERTVIATLAEAMVAGSVSFDRVRAALQERTLTLLDHPLKLLQRYEDLLNQKQDGPLIKLRELLAASQTELPAITALAGPGLDSLRLALKRLDDDCQLLDAIFKARSAKPVNLLNLAKALDELRKAWANDGPGLVEALRIVERLVRSLFAGQLGAFFDFSAIRAELEAQLLALLPTKVSQRYAWRTSLDDFPAGDPIFQIDRAQPSEQSQDLGLEANVTIDLAKNQRTATVCGRLRPFKIRLLGNRLDLVTVKFKGATFEAGTGQSPRYDAPIADVEIGTMLEFIKAFQQYFSPGEGNGPYVALRLAPPEIEAGYRYSTPLITVGNLAVLNVSISVAMLLPFDNRQAYFRFAFGARDNPFIIAAMPYAGGGFVALLASPKGIIGFEICFEFGALVALRFGPMRGNGRVMAGIYLRSEPGMQVLEGYVTAVGEGSIACFGISVNICVKVRQEQGGAMVGSSTYSFAFKVGFATLRYSFKAQYQVQGGSRKQASGQRALRVSTIGEAGKAACQRVATRVPRKHVSWGRYRKHVAI